MGETSKSKFTGYAGYAGWTGYNSLPLEQKPFNPDYPVYPC
jgi:hypothetical protein